MATVAAHPSTPPTPLPPSPGASPMMARRGLPRMQELGLVVVIVLLYGALTVMGFKYPTHAHPNAFLNFDNQFNGIATSMSEYAIMAIGMTCVIITGGIDISVGSIMGLAAISGAWVLQFMSPDAPWYTVLPVALLVPAGVGVLCGLVNGLLVVGLRMHPFIVSLGTMSIIRGLCVLLFPATVPSAGREVPQAFVAFMGHEFSVGSHIQHLRLVPIFVMAVVIILGGIFLHALVAGRETYAIGGNAEAARFSGIRVWWATLRVYIIMGLCCGVSAFVALGRFYSISTNEGNGYELTVIASAVVGGASLVGGKGTALGRCWGR